MDDTSVQVHFLDLQRVWNLKLNSSWFMRLQ